MPADCLYAEPKAPLTWDAHLQVLREVIALHAGRPTPPAASLQARRLLLDTLGCALAGRRADEVQQLETGFSRLDPGAFCFPEGKGMAMHGATQVLAMAATWDEACEGHALAHGRPGVPLVAALLPLGLQLGASLGAFTDAFVLGYEIGARAGAWLRIRSGMHVDANWPALGVAAGVARLMGLPAAGIMQAVNIAACQLPTSLYLPVVAGRTARNTYLAHSAVLGLQAAFASAAGVDAPHDALAHYASTYATAAPQPLPAPMTMLLLDAYFKPFAAVRHVHYGAVAALRIREQLHSGTQDIRSIVLTVYEEATVYCGNRAPLTPIQAQFSLSFGVAAMLRFGNIDPPVYAAAHFNDPELRRLEALVVLQVDPDLTMRGQRGATLLVQSESGLLQESVDSIAGDASHPLDRAALCEKFQRYAAHSVSSRDAMEFCTALLDSHPDIELYLLWQQLLPSPSPADPASVPFKTLQASKAAHP